VAVPSLEGVPRDDVDSDAEEFLKVLDQADVIKKGSAWLEVHQQVYIAVWASLSPCDPAHPGDASMTPFAADCFGWRCHRFNLRLSAPYT
jgi:hypothetical protein